MSKEPSQIAREYGTKLVDLCHMEHIDEEEFDRVLDELKSSLTDDAWPISIDQCGQFGKSKESVPKLRFAKMSQHQEDGTWGAYKKRTALGGIFKADKWRTGKDAKKSLRMAKKLIDAGADVTAYEGSRDWRGSGRSVRIDTVGLSLGMLNSAVKSANERTALVQMLLSDDRVDINEVQEQFHHSMRTDGSSSSTHFLNAIGTCPTHAKIILPWANLRVWSTEHISNERGYDQSQNISPLYTAVQSWLQCKHNNAMRKEYFSLIVALVRASASPNDYVWYLIHRENEARSELDAAEDDPRAEGYVSPVVCVRVCETAVHLVLREEHTAASDFLAYFLLCNDDGDEHPKRIEVDRARFGIQQEVRILRAKQEGSIMNEELRAYADALNCNDRAHEALMSTFRMNPFGMLFLPEECFGLLPSCIRRALKLVLLCLYRIGTPPNVAKRLMQEYLHGVYSVQFKHPLLNIYF